MNNHPLRPFSTGLLLLWILSIAACVRSDDNTQAQMILPEDMPGYRQQMANYAQAGGENPFPSIAMVKRPFHNPGQQPVAAALAQQVAAAVLENRPQAAKLVYFRQLDNTAHVVLAMDENAWAGVSASIAAVRPLIELNLTRLPGIDSVVFGRPADAEAGTPSQ